MEFVLCFQIQHHCGKLSEKTFKILPVFDMKDGIYRKNIANFEDFISENQNIRFFFFDSLSFPQVVENCLENFF